MKEALVILLDIDGTAIGKNIIDLEGISKIINCLNELKESYNVYGHFITGRGIEASEFAMKLYGGHIGTTYGEYGGVVVKLIRENSQRKRWKYNVSPQFRSSILELQQYLERKGMQLEPKQTMITVRSNPQRLDEDYECVKKILEKKGISFVEGTSSEETALNFISYRKMIYRLTHSKTTIDFYPSYLGKDWCVRKILSSIWEKTTNAKVIVVGDSTCDIPMMKEAVRWAEKYKVYLYGINPSTELEDELNEIGGKNLFGKTPEKCLFKILSEL